MTATAEDMHPPHAGISEAGIRSDERTGAVFDALNIDSCVLESGANRVYSPVDGEAIASIAYDTAEDRGTKLAAAHAAFSAWRLIPAPRRGELVRQFGNVLRQNKEPLAALVAIESGKIWTEALGEVQEMIDVCDFAVGLSRQLYGLTMGSERPGHKLAEYWHPIGIVGVISAFNFPVAVWAWNTAIALVCGDTVVWKPSEKTPMTAIACSALLQRTVAAFGDAPKDIHQLMIGDAWAGKDLVADPCVAVVSATGSTAMGRKVAPVVAERFGRCILELGGNNAMIVSASADLDMAVEAIVFAAVGTAGQRCTTLRRVIAHESIVDELFDKVVARYKEVRIGDPFHRDSLVGPLVDRHAFENMQMSISALEQFGCTVYGGERVKVGELDGGYYVAPAVARIDADYDGARNELFAPLLYVISYSEFEEAIAIQNNVPQGLSSAIFSNDIRETERFLSAAGSDCGIANVNTGPSGAEIGGAFGGEKETGGGRESGSDSWKAYMRRMTATVNYSEALPLAQGVDFRIAASDRPDAKGK